MFTMDLVKYLEETHTVLITREAFESLKERAIVKMRVGSLIPGVYMLIYVVVIAYQTRLMIVTLIIVRIVARR